MTRFAFETTGRTTRVLGTDTHGIMIIGVLAISAILTAAPAHASCCCPFASEVAGPGQTANPATNGPGADPRAVQSGKIHEDTPEAREEVLRRRPVAEGTKVPSDVPPLPAQAISPPAPLGR
jgi:hypothetical protein